MSTSTNAIMQPLLLVHPRGVLPERYRVVLRTTICTHCGTTHETPELYAFQTLRSRHTSKLVTNFVAVETLDYNVPIDCVTMTPKHIAICHECFPSVNLSHLPEPPRPETSATPVGGHRQTPATKAAARPRTLPTSLNDI